MRKPVLQNVGAQTDETENEVVFEDQSNPNEDNVTPEGNEDNDNDAQALSDQEAADLEAAGVNTSEADDEKARKRQYRQLIKKVASLGTEYGAGKISMIALAETVTEAAMRKAVYPDDAEALYDKFKEMADDKATIDDAGLVPDAATSEKPDNKTADQSRASQLSKLKNFIKLGNKFNDDAGDLIRRARNIHLEALKGDRVGLKKGSTYSILTGIAGANEKRNDKTENEKTDEEIHKYHTVPVKEDTTHDGAKKILDALISAKAARNGGKEREPVSNVHLDNAINELSQALGEVNADLLTTHEAEEKAKADKRDKKAA